MATTFREVPSPSKLLDVDLTIISAKHLKNVNWRHGNLVPYAVVWIDPDHKLPTGIDSTGGTKPVWNERLSISLPLSNLDHSFLTIDVLHAPDRSSPLSKTLVGSARLSLSDVARGCDKSPRLLSLELCRPSNRPQGKIKVKIAVKERALPPAPPPASTPASYFPPPSQSRDLRGYSSYQYVDPSYLRPSNYYPGLYTPPIPFPPPPPPPQVIASDYPNRSGYLPGPSAPFDSSSQASPSLYTADYARGKASNVGVGPAVAVGPVVSAVSGLSMEEGRKCEEEKAPDRAEKDLLSGRDRFSDYHVHY